MEKRGQVWVETVIYTLIAFAMIGMVLAYAKPKIEAMQDKVAIEQALVLMEGIDQSITSILHGGQGNVRKLEIGIDKGNLIFDSENNKISFVLESRHKYSEPGKSIMQGIFLVQTDENGKYYRVNITKNYVDYDLQFDKTQDKKVLEKAVTPHVIYVSNEGKNGEGIIIINVKIG